ncbi:MAG: polyvinylalcohol dehydrogenase [Blastopirellula sp.]|nr:polyvinylalcohol dehydrogenase [Blastopirellula sp.]
MHRLTGILIFFTVCPCFAEDRNWPQFRGPDRNSISTETGLLKSWPEGGPKRTWMFTNAGRGYSSFAISDGKLLTMGSRDGKEQLIAIDANKGTELWQADVGEELENGWGNGPRSTPTVDGDHVYALGGRGDLICAKTSDGSVVWKKSMSDFGGKTPNWGYCESVLIDGNKVVCTPGGDQGTMLALNKETGETLWQSKEITDGAQYASIITADLNGQHQLIQLTQQHVFAVNAENGDLLWQADWDGRVAVIPTPIYHDRKVYVSSGYGVGCMLVEIGPDNVVEQKYKNKVMKNHHGGVVLLDGKLYGYSDGPGWTCQDFGAGEEVWSDKRKLGKGSLAYADGMFYCLAKDSGEVALIDASPEGWNEHGRFTLEPQTEIRSDRGRIWTHPVVVNGKLYLRDQDMIYCYDIKR